MISNQVIQNSIDELRAITKVDLGVFDVEGLKVAATVDAVSYTHLLEKMPKNLPVLFMSGTKDPVGDYGKAVEGVYRSFRELGMTNVNIKLYEDDRHELVNESDREMVWKDIYEWVRRTASAKNP